MRRGLWVVLGSALVLAVVVGLTPAVFGSGGSSEVTSTPVAAANWSGRWGDATGKWTGTITFHFDDSGSKAWTEEEKRVIREAIQEWEEIPDTNISFQETNDLDLVPADVTFRWASGMDRDGNGLRGTTAGVMTGGEGDAAPSGVDFNSGATAGWFVDPDPLTDDQPIPEGVWDLVSVAKHEIGHVLGLHHSYRADGEESVDWDVWGTGERQRLTEKDGTAARRLYPAAPGKPDAAFLGVPTGDCCQGDLEPGEYAVEVREGFDGATIGLVMDRFEPTGSDPLLYRGPYALHMTDYRRVVDLESFQVAPGGYAPARVDGESPLLGFSQYGWCATLNLLSSSPARVRMRDAQGQVLFDEPLSSLPSNDPGTTNPMCGFVNIPDPEAVVEVDLDLFGTHVRLLGACLRDAPPDDLQGFCQAGEP